MATPKTTKVSAKELQLNPNNPRLIKDEKFKKLVKSIKEFPQMIQLRPIVVDENNVILGGNMRYRAMVEAGMTDVYVIKAEGLSEEQKREFIIKDNVGYGEWDWDVLANEWDTQLLDDWGINLPMVQNDVDYSILDDNDVSDKITEMTDSVKKAICIEFELEHYEEASEMVKFWREQQLYIGGFLLEKLKDERRKLNV
jgi:hypothetical protein